MQDRPHHELLSRGLGRTGKVSQKWFDARLAEAGGDLTTWIVLNNIADEPSQKELAAHMWIEPATLVAHLDRLEGDGVVERRRDPDDRRVIRVVVTPAGKQLHGRLREVAISCDAELRALLPAKDQQVLERSLARLFEHFTTTSNPKAGR
jgi:MarR family transcriptional regulator, transcriptional regulator for hemolysin